MARIGYVSRDTMPEGRTDLYDRLAAERGPNLEHIFLALANAPDLAEAVLGLATALRKKTTLSRVFRELAVVTVGLETDAQYEVEHHWNAALRAGVRGNSSSTSAISRQRRASPGRSARCSAWRRK
jgi:alkylhydroperoxidase family enzyme